MGDSSDKPCKVDAGGAVIPLFEALTEQLSLPRVSVVLGGAVALHKEATRRGVDLIRLDAAEPDVQGRRSSLVDSAKAKLRNASDSLPLPAADVVGERLGGYLQSGAGAARASFGGGFKSLRRLSKQGVQAVRSGGASAAVSAVFMPKDKEAKDSKAARGSPHSFADIMGAEEQHEATLVHRPLGQAASPHMATPSTEMSPG